jgi:hypothetical protein
MGNLEFGTPDGNAPFLILPVLSVVTFAVVASTGLGLRADAAAHKRLMLIGTIVLSDAGFSRWIGPWLGPFLHKMYGPGFMTFFIPHFICGSALMVAILGYDLATRRRLHPVVLSAVVFAEALHVVTTVVYRLPAWTPIATHILGR